MLLKHETTRQHTWGIALFVLILCMSPFRVDGATTTVSIGQQFRVYTPMKSFKALRDENMVRQAYDYSCGAAAMATLLTYGLGDQVTEAEILQEVLTLLSKDEITLRKKKGLSLLDLQKLAKARGYKAQGFRLAPELLNKLTGPVLIFIKPGGYEHFAILKGVRGKRAYLADPSLGNVRIPMYKFQDMWLDETGKGVVFIVERADSPPSVSSPLYRYLEGPQQTPSYPEVLSTRQLLETQTPQVRIPQVLQSLPRR